MAVEGASRENGEGGCSVAFQGGCAGEQEDAVRPVSAVFSRPSLYEVVPWKCFDIFVLVCLVCSCCVMIGFW